jgi:hypothetical protein
VEGRIREVGAGVGAKAEARGEIRAEIGAGIRMEIVDAHRRIPPCLSISVKDGVNSLNHYDL